MSRGRKRMKIVTYVPSSWKLGWDLGYRHEKGKYSEGIWWSGETAEAVVLIHKKKHFHVKERLAVADRSYVKGVAQEIASRMGLPYSHAVKPGWTMQQLVLHRLRGGD